MRQLLDVLRSFWRAGFKPFFLCDRWRYRLIAWVGMIIMIVLMVINVWGAVVLSYQVNTLGVAIQSGATHEEYMPIVHWIMGLIILFFVTDSCVGSIMLPMYAWFWQKALMVRNLDLWDQRTSAIDDVAQRIKDCSKEIAVNVSAFCVRFFRCVLGFIAFAPIIWKLSEHFQYIAPIPGLLLWFMILVCFLETVVSWILGRVFKLREREKNRQQADAILRTRLEREQDRRTRETATEKSAWRREIYKLINLLQKATFAPIYAGTPLMVWQQITGNFWGYGMQLGFGYLVAVLKIFPYGIMRQTINVLGEIHNSLSIFSNSWQTITMLQATVERIEEIEEIVQT